VKSCASLLFKTHILIFPFVDSAQRQTQKMDILIDFLLLFSRLVLGEPNEKSKISVFIRREAQDFTLFKYSDSLE
jgi:hypothetical protein